MMHYGYMKKQNRPPVFEHSTFIYQAVVHHDMVTSYKGDIFLSFSTIDVKWATT